MGSHRLMVTVAPGRGEISRAVTRIDGNGHTQTKEIVLERSFVLAVKLAYVKLTLPGIDTSEIVRYVWANLLGLPGAQRGSEREVELALGYLADAGEILLPAPLDEVPASA